VRDLSTTALEVLERDTREDAMSQKPKTCPELAELPHNASEWLALTSARTVDGGHLRSAHRVSASPLALTPYTHTRAYPSGSFPFCGVQLGWGDVVTLVAPGADAGQVAAELEELAALVRERGAELLAELGLTSRRVPGLKWVSESARQRHRHIIRCEAAEAARAGAEWLASGNAPAPDPTPREWPGERFARDFESKGVK
jgi:hypothetical protein